MTNIEPYLQNKIFEKSNNKINIKEAINEFLYIGKFDENDEIFYNIKQKLNIDKYRCLCNRTIKNICIYANKYNNNIIILGSDCMKRFLNKYINKKYKQPIQKIINKDKNIIDINLILDNYDNIINELRKFMIICDECQGVYPLHKLQEINNINNNDICLLCLEKIINKLYIKRNLNCNNCGYSCCKYCYYFYNFIKLKKTLKQRNINNNYYTN